MTRTVFALFALSIAPSALACGMYVPERSINLAELFEDIDLGEAVVAEADEKDASDEATIVLLGKNGEPVKPSPASAPQS